MVSFNFILYTNIKYFSIATKNPIMRTLNLGPDKVPSVKHLRPDTSGVFTTYFWDPELLKNSCRGEETLLYADPPPTM